MKVNFKKTPKQFVIIPAIGFTWERNKGSHFYFAWLKFRVDITWETKNQGV